MLFRLQFVCVVGIMSAVFVQTIAAPVDQSIPEISAILKRFESLKYGVGQTFSAIDPDDADSIKNINALISKMGQLLAGQGDIPLFTTEKAPTSGSLRTVNGPIFLVQQLIFVGISTTVFLF